MSTARQYELVYIALPDTTEEGLAELHTQIAGIVERFGGSVERTEPWGRRKLAYEIGRHREGVYVLEVLNGPGNMTAELDRRLRVTDTVMRHLIVRVDEELAIAERAKTTRKASTVARRLRRGLPAEPTESEVARRKEHEEDDMDSGPDMGFRGDRDRDRERGDR
jgi:small subunit ribosomal protein S6